MAKTCDNYGCDKPRSPGETLCKDCLEAWRESIREPTLGEKAKAIAFIAPVVAYFTTTECVLKPAIRKTKKLLKALGDWAEH